MSGNFSEVLIGPCGMNCGICYAFLKEKNGLALIVEELLMSIRKYVRIVEMGYNRK